MNEIRNGTDVLRATLRARDRAAGALTRIARECGMSVSTLEAFAAGKTDLDVATLKRLTTELHSNAEFDEESGMLRLTNRAAPIAIGKGPPPYKPTPKTYQVGVLQGRGPQPVVPEKPKPKTSRPGWLGGWL